MSPQMKTSTNRNVADRRGSNLRVTANGHENYDFPSISSGGSSDMRFRSSAILVSILSLKVKSWRLFVRPSSLFFSCGFHLPNTS
jgi:hypothetical protein